MFREIIEKGAFARMIREKQDVRALWNHNADKVLGRRKNDTLILKEDDHGLLFDLILPDTQAGRDAAVSVSRGDVDQMSFGFLVHRTKAKKGEKWEDEDTPKPLRRLLDLDVLDVSPVAFAAYEETEVGLRSAQLVWSAYVEERDDLQEQVAAARIAADANAQGRSFAKQLELLKAQTQHESDRFRLSRRMR
jgi:HK97 family phage prohead protease